MQMSVVYKTYNELFEYCLSHMDGLLVVRWILCYVIYNMFLFSEFDICLGVFWPQEVHVMFIIGSLVNGIVFQSLYAQPNALFILCYVFQK